MTALLAGPLDDGHPYLCRMIAALRGLGHSIAVAELEAARDDAVATARALQNTPAHEPLIIDASALSAFARMAHPPGLRRATLFVRETAPEGDLATILPQLGPVIVTSEPARQRLASQLASAAQRTRVIEPGTEADLPRSEGPANPDGCAILAPAPAWPRSDLPLLLRALARLADLDWTLTVAGGSAADPALMTQAAECGVAERLHVADATMLDRIWQRAGLCVLATGDDGDGLAVSEALRRGVPLAVAAGPGITGRIPHAAGATAVAGDLVALSNAMRRLILDARLRCDMSDAAWEAGRTLPTWETQAGRFANALEE